MNNDTPLALVDSHLDECHLRWSKDSNYKQDEEWRGEQCGGCLYYIPLTGLFRSDWGVCSNPASRFDAQTRFEHDGCEAYSDASEWVTGPIQDWEDQERAKET